MNEVEKLKREMLSRKYSQKSINTYASCLGVLIKKVGPELDIEKSKDFFITIKSRSYHKQLVSTLRNYYAFVKHEETNFSNIPYPRKEHKLPEILSQQEMKKILDQPKNLKHQAIISILYNCGLRISELINLKMENIDRKRGVITIKAAKGFKDRQVPLSEKLSKLLVDYYMEFHPKVYLFNGQQGLLYTESSVNQLLKYWAKKAGVNKRIHAHKIRHCFATHLLERGTDISIIQDLLGHEDPRTTKIYAKISTAYISKIPSLI